MATWRAILLNVRETELEEMDALERRHRQPQPEQEGQFRQVHIELLREEVHVVLDVDDFRAYKTVNDRQTKSTSKCPKYSTTVK